MTKSTKLMFLGFLVMLGARASAKKERFQSGDEHLISRAVILTFQGAALHIREDGGKLVCPMTHKRMPFLTPEEHCAIHHERGDRNGSPLPERQRVAAHSVSHDRAIVSERVR